MPRLGVRGVAIGLRRLLSSRLVNLPNGSPVSEGGTRLRPLGRDRAEHGDSECNNREYEVAAAPEDCHWTVIQTY
jgi:hypothetical protein